MEKKEDIGAVFISTGKIARRLGVHRDTVRSWCKSGKLPYIKIGKRYMVPLNKLAERYPDLIASEIVWVEMRNRGVIVEDEDDWIL